MWLQEAGHKMPGRLEQTVEDGPGPGRRTTSITIWTAPESQGTFYIFLTNCLVFSVDYIPIPHNLFCP